MRLRSGVDALAPAGAVGAEAAEHGGFQFGAMLGGAHHHTRALGCTTVRCHRSTSTAEFQVVSEAMNSLYAFTGGIPPQNRLIRLQGAVTKLNNEQVAALLANESLDDALLRSLLVIKQLAGEINVAIHAVGIMLTLPYILENDERVDTVSLGAGAGLMKHDLETTRRIAEFKFIHWRGQDAVREDGLFADFVKLAESSDSRHRQLCLFICVDSAPVAIEVPTER